MRSYPTLPGIPPDPKRHHSHFLAEFTSNYSCLAVFIQTIIRVNVSIAPSSRAKKK